MSRASMFSALQGPQPNGRSFCLSCSSVLAARALGYGGVITGFHGPVDKELKSLLAIPDEVFISCTVTLGKPAGSHGPVRRRPLSELVFEDEWSNSPSWAMDPPGTRFTSAGPPKS